MKNAFLFLTLLGVGFMFSLSTSPVEAASEKNVPSGYYILKPSLNDQLQVNYSFKLDYLNSNYEKFEFFYVSQKNAYIINDQYSSASVQWKGFMGIDNINWGNQNIQDDSMLWNLEKISNNQYMIRNKKNPTLVWDVHNYYPTLGATIKVENEHPLHSPQRAAQIFTLENQR